MLEGLGFGIVELAAIEPHRPGGRPFLRRRCAARYELQRHASSPMCFASCSAARSTCFSTALTEIPYRSAISRSEEHTSELQSLMRISYAVFCLKKKNSDIYRIN